MSTDAISTFLALGAPVMLGAALAAAVLLAAGRRGGSWRESLLLSLGGRALPLAWLVSLAATLGSLYYSEIAHFEPCLFCWYQRVAMYPLTIVLGIGAFTRDRNAHRSGITLAALGAGIAGYHYLVQHFPGLSAGSCSASAPCTAAWIWKFGFVSIPFMALACFTAVVVLLVVDRIHHRAVDSW
jgi:disulfide bond formation protein DsbB